MEPDISIIIPIYNGEKYIGKAVESILRQTLKNFELILVNDGSTDSSGEIIDRYGKADSRIKIIHQENQGVSAARNNGLAKAEGRYVGFVDADDWIEPEMYEILYAEAIKYNCDLVICDFSYENNHSTILHNFADNVKGNNLMERKEIIDEICTRLLTEGIFTSVCDKIYKRSMLDMACLRFKGEIKMREDFFFNIDVFNAVERAIYLPQVLYHYRNTTGSACKRYYKNTYETAEAIFKYKLKYMKIWNLEKEVENTLYSDYITAIQFSIKNIFDKRNDEHILSKYKNVRNIVYDDLVSKSVLLFNDENNKSKFEMLVFKLVKSKSAVLLSLIYFISAQIPEYIKIKVKQLIR